MLVNPRRQVSKVGETVNNNIGARVRVTPLGSSVFPQVREVLDLISAVQTLIGTLVHVFGL